MRGALRLLAFSGSCCTMCFPSLSPMFSLSLFWKPTNAEAGSADKLYTFYISNLFSQLPYKCKTDQYKIHEMGESKTRVF